MTLLYPCKNKSFGAPLMKQIGALGIAAMREMAIARKGLTIQAIQLLQTMNFFLSSVV
jgi:hypothetical protein